MKHKPGQTITVIHRKYKGKDIVGTATRIYPMSDHLYAIGKEEPHYPVPALLSHYTWPWEWSFGYRVVQFENRGMRAFYY